MMAAPLLELYRSLRRIRRVEEEIARIYPTDKIKSPVHLSIGQESIAVGVCAALREDDFVSPTYRGHAAFLAKGGSLNGMFAELFGKRTGVAKGKGGSMHLIDPAARVLGASAVVGTNIPVAVGHALSIKMNRGDQVVACFFGDGATEEGVFYESLNFAALHELPLLFVCENNNYAIHTATEKRWASPDLSGRVTGFGIPIRRFEAQNVLDLFSHATEAVVRIRKGGGPEFFECHTYRWREHVGPSEDYDKGYRDKSELAPWQKRDDVLLLAERLDSKERSVIDEEIEAEIAEAVEFAESSPAPSISELFDHVYDT